VQYDFRKKDNKVLPKRLYY